MAANRPGPSYVCLNQGGGRFATPCIPIPGRVGDVDRARRFRQGRVRRSRRAEPRRRAEPDLLQRRQGRLRADGAVRSRRTRPGVSAPPPTSTATAGSISRSATRAAASLVVYMNDRKGGLVCRLPRRGQGAVPYAMTAGDLNRRRQPGHRASATPRGRTPCSSTTGLGGPSARSGSATRRARPTASRSATSIGDGFPDIALARSGAPNVLYLSGK